MKKLILILLAFFAVFSYINAFSSAETEENEQEIPPIIPTELSMEIVQ